MEKCSYLQQYQCCWTDIWPLCSSIKDTSRVISVSVTWRPELIVKSQRDTEEKCSESPLHDREVSLCCWTICLLLQAAIIHVRSWEYKTFITCVFCWMARTNTTQSAVCKLCGLKLCSSNRKHNWEHSLQPLLSYSSSCCLIFYYTNMESTLNAD